MLTDCVEFFCVVKLNCQSRKKSLIHIKSEDEEVKCVQSRLVQTACYYRYTGGRADLRIKSASRAAQTGWRFERHDREPA